MSPARSPRALRMWGVRCALDTGVAHALGLTSSELAARLMTRSLAQIADECGVPMPTLREIAWTIAEPQLAAAVAAGAIHEGERTALHRRIDEKRGPWQDLPFRRVRTRHHSSPASTSSSSSLPAQVLGGSEAGKLSSSSSSSLSSSSRVTPTSRSSS